MDAAARSEVAVVVAGRVEIVLIRAANPGPMTLDGTNTWLVLGPRPATGSPRTALLIDPGPEIPEHLEAIGDEVRSRGGRLTGIVLTHRHKDHSAALASVEEWAPGVPVHAALEEFRRGTGEITDGAALPLTGDDPSGADSSDSGSSGAAAPGDAPELRFLLTPGHTSDSLSILAPGGILFSGDTVLGRGTTVVTYPHGSIRDYLASVTRLRELAGRGEISRILPGHGAVIEDPAAVLDHYLEHRRERLAQVSAALSAGATTPEEVVDAVYPDIAENLRSAALQSTRAQLDYLTSLR